MQDPILQPLHSPQKADKLHFIVLGGGGYEGGGGGVNIAEKLGGESVKFRTLETPNRNV